MNGVKLGVSTAASWAWGTSLIVGMEIAQTKGLAAWGIWATANTATLAVFGALTRSGFLARHVFDAKGIKAAALLIQVFCLVIQLSIISRVVVGMGASPLAGYLAASSVGVLFTVWMYRHGLITSVLTDQYQWIVTMTALALDLIKHPERLAYGGAPSVLREVKNLYVQFGSYWVQRDWRNVYQILIAGDPKKRSLRALRTQSVISRNTENAAH